MNENDSKTNDSPHIHLNLPENINSIERDNFYRKAWLTKEYADRMTIIRNQATLFAEQCHQVESSLTHYTPHDFSHCSAVEDNIHRLIPGESYKSLSEHERFYLLATAWLHDLGLYAEGLEEYSVSGKTLRNNHHLYSGKIIVEKFQLLGIKPTEVDILSVLVKFHRKKENIYSCPEIMVSNKIAVRVRLLASYLRLADALHIDQTRVAPSDYAAALTYNIPYSQKMHWIRSRLVMGIDIDSASSKIIVHLKYPSNVHDRFTVNIGESIRAFDINLHKIYKKFILQEIRDELCSVEKVLIENGITSFINIDYVVHKIYFDKKLLDEVLMLSQSELSIRKPSSTSLYESVIETITSYIKHYNSRIKHVLADKKEKESISAETCSKISSFINEQLVMIDNLKYCHFKSASMLINIKEMIESKDEVYQPKKNISSQAEAEGAENGTPCSDANSETTTQKDIFSRIIERIDGKMERYPNAFCSDLRKDKSYEKLKNVLGELEGAPKHREKHHILTFLEHYIKFFLLLEKADKNLIRYNSAKYIYPTDNTFCTDKKNHNKYATSYGYAAWQIEAIVDKITVEFFASSTIYENCPSSYWQEYLDDGSKKFEGIYSPPARIGILLYGYSTCTLKTLCGFRDAIIEKVIGRVNDLSCDNSLYHLGQKMHKYKGDNYISSKVSEMFDIFVCEGQSKNIIKNGRLRYHDGLEYISALNRRGFQNVKLIADAISGTLLTQYYKVNLDKDKLLKSKLVKEEFDIKYPRLDELYNIRNNLENDKIQTVIYHPRINFFMIGVNGYCDKYLYHSAGHLANISNVLQKGRTLTIVSTQTNKYVDAMGYKKKLLFKLDRSIPCDSASMINESGFRAYQSYKGEKIRLSNFTFSNEDYFDSIGKNDYDTISPTVIYTPSEDLIRFHDVDIIITEFCTVNMSQLAADKESEEPIYVHGPRLLVDKRQASPPWKQCNSCNTVLENYSKNFENAGKKLFNRSDFFCDPLTETPNKTDEPFTEQKQSMSSSTSTNLENQDRSVDSAG